MSGVIGQGTATYTPAGGSAISFKFHAPDNFTVFTREVPVVDSTADDDTTKTFKLGNLPDNGDFVGTLEALAESYTELKSSVPTTGTLTWTSDLEDSTNGTQATVSGTVGFYSVGLAPEHNGLVKAPAKFKWLGDITITDESA
ncbi:MAG: hypothetical protein NE327_12405 [Lentisphaeraceae bacterium]|nr:hypothetical protein [Lentisphaeraceae bacterium]